LFTLSLIHALRRVVDMFVRFYNICQVHKRKYPHYSAVLKAMIRHSPEYY
jgi:hypothetical protein